MWNEENKKNNAGNYKKGGRGEHRELRKWKTLNRTVV